MGKIRRLLAASLFSLLAQAAQVSAERSGEAVVSAGPDAQRVAAAVNGRPIYVWQLDRAAEPALDRLRARIMERTGQDSLPEEQWRPLEGFVRSAVLNEMVHSLLLAQAALDAEKRGVVEQAEERFFQQELSSLRKSHRKPDDLLLNSLAPLAHFVGSIEEYARAKLVVERLIRQVMNSAKVTPEEIKGFFESNRTIYGPDLERAKDRVERDLRYRKENQAYLDWLASLHRNAAVDIRVEFAAKAPSKKDWYHYQVYPCAVKITEPKPGFVFGRVRVVAAYEGRVTPTRLAFLVDGKPLAVLREPPYEFHWDSFLGRAGDHRIKVQAFDANENVLAEAEIEVTTDSAWAILNPEH